MKYFQASLCVVFSFTPHLSIWFKQWLGMDYLSRPTCWLSKVLLSKGTWSSIITNSIKVYYQVSLKQGLMCFSYFYFYFFVVCIMKYFIYLIYELYISLKRSVIFHSVSVTSYLTVICYSHYFVCACPQDVLTIQLELGHQADFKREISPNGFTHDWSVFVRGQDGAPIQHFVEKVVFHLHETFKNPKRGKLWQWGKDLDSVKFINVIIQWFVVYFV